MYSFALGAISEGESKNAGYVPIRYTHTHHSHSAARSTAVPPPYLQRAAVRIVCVVVGQATFSSYVTCLTEWFYHYFSLPSPTLP